MDVYYFNKYNIYASDGFNIKYRYTGLFNNEHDAIIDAKICNSHLLGITLNKIKSSPKDYFVRQTEYDNIDNDSLIISYVLDGNSV